jgi:hypothetical protein
LSWWLAGSCSLLFGSHELDTKTLPEDATSAADPTCGEEAWFKPKTRFTGVETFKKSAIGADLATALRPASFEKVVSIAPQAIALVILNRHVCLKTSSM